MAGITLTDVRKSYAGNQVIHGISTRIADGEFVVIVGPSGCGKSTLLHLAAGLEKPTQGAVLADGQAVSGPHPSRTLVFQEHALYPWLTLLDNVALALEFQKAPKARAREAARQWLARVSLAGFEDYYPHQVSGGMRQRAALARAFIAQPQTLLMDEPFGALDNQTRVLMQELLLGIWEAERKTVMFVTHDIDEAIFMANRVAVFSARPGRIKSEIAVHLPHPRHYRVKTSPEFMELKARLTEEIRAESMAAEAH